MLENLKELALTTGFANISLGQFIMILVSFVITFTADCLWRFVNQPAVSWVDGGRCDGQWEVPARWVNLLSLPGSGIRNLSSLDLFGGRGDDRFWTITR